MRERFTLVGNLRTMTRSAFRLALAFLRRDLLEAASYRFAVLLDLVAILFTVAMFYFVAQLIDPSSTSFAALSGGYFPFVLIGLALYGFLGTALGTFARNIRQAQVRGTLEAMLATRTSLSAILLCSSLWSFCYKSLEVAFYLAVGSLIFGAELGGANPLATALVLAATILAFTGLGILSAAFVVVFKRGDPVAYAVSGASALVGGVFYPVAVLPSGLQELARWLPITHALRATRRTILEGAGLAEVSGELAALLLFAAVLLPLGLLAFKLAVHRAKVEGSLCQY